MVLKSLKNPKATTVTVPSSYYTDSIWGTEIKPCYISKDAFKNNKNIQTIIFKKQYEGNYHSRIYDPATGKSTNDMSYMFSNMSKLTSVDFTGIDIQGAQDFSYMFAGDTSLKNLQGISTLDTSDGIDFSHIFDGCQSLTSIDLSNWNLSKAKDMSAMFSNCRKLIEVKIDELPNGINMRDMFHNAPVIYAKLIFNRSSYYAGNVENIFLLDEDKFGYLPLVVYSNSQTFLNTEKGTPTTKYYTYNAFAGDGRVLPFILSSGKGLFTQTIKPPYPSRFDVGSVENHDEKICMLQGITNGFAINKDPMNQLSNPKATIQKVIGDVKPYPTIQNNQMPPKDDESRFYAGYYDDETKQRMNGWHKLFDSAPTYLKNIFAKVTAQYSPVNPEMAKGHTVDSKNPTSKDWPDNRMPQGPLGFAYQPSTLTADNMELDGKEKHTSLTSDGQTAFHLGVRDYTQTPSPWTVSARLSWNDKPMNQATIQASGGGIKLNMNSLNNNTNNPKPFKDSQLNNYGKSNVQSLIQSGMTLSNGQMIQIMKADGQQDRAFYDLTLGNLTLNVPNDSKLQPKSYQGQIDWNLTTGPNGK